MSQHTSEIIRKPRTDDRPLWDVYWGAYGYFAIHIAHGVGVFTLLVNGPRTLDQACQALGLKRRAAEAITRAWLGGSLDGGLCELAEVWWSWACRVLICPAALLLLLLAARFPGTA